MAEALVVGEDVSRLGRLCRTLRDEGHRVSIATTIADALEFARREHYDIVLVDFALRSMNGLEVVRRIGALQPDGAVVVLVDGNVHQAVGHMIAFGEPVRRGWHRCVTSAMGLIEDRYREPVCSARTIARAIGISEEYLCRLFKKQTGRTMGALVHEARVREARRLLADTPLTVKEIALSVGYSSTGHLERHFKRLVRTTPIAYRRSSVVRPDEVNNWR